MYIKTNKEMVKIDNPASMPSPTEIEHIEEPYVKATVIVPNDYVGPVMEISQEKTWRIQNYGLS